MHHAARRTKDPDRRYIGGVSPSLPMFLYAWRQQRAVGLLLSRHDENFRSGLQVGPLARRYADDGRIRRHPQSSSPRPCS